MQVYEISNDGELSQRRHTVKPIALAGRISRAAVFKAMLLCVTVGPWIYPGGAFPGIRPEWIILLFGLIVFEQRSASVHSERRLAWMAFTVMFSLSFGAVFHDVPVILSDFLEIFKPLLYLTLLAFVTSMRLTDSEAVDLIRFIVTVLAIIAVASILQRLLSVPLLDKWFSLYSDATRIELYKQDPRTIGTMGNANDFGMLMNIAFALTLFQASSRAVFRSHASWLIHVTMFFFAVIQSGSRTGFIVAGVILASLLLRDRRWRLMSLVGILAFIGLIFFNRDKLLAFIPNVGALYRLGTLLTASTDWSVVGRIRGAGYELQTASQSIVFGWGPAKAIHIGENLDNELVLLLRRYGLVGFAVYGAVATSLFQSLKMSVTGIASFKERYCLSVRAILLGALVYSITAGAYHVFRIGFTIILLAGLGITMAASGRETR